MKFELRFGRLVALVLILAGLLVVAQAPASPLAAQEGAQPSRGPTGEYACVHAQLADGAEN
jgi:hypothetical protein